MHVVKYGAPEAPLAAPDADGPFVRWQESASQACGKGWVVHIDAGIADGYYLKENDALRDYSFVMEVLKA